MTCKIVMPSDEEQFDEIQERLEREGVTLGHIDNNLMIVDGDETTIRNIVATYPDAKIIHA